MGADAFGVFSDENSPQSILSCRLVSGSCPYHHSPLRTKNQSACALGKCRIPDSPAAAFFGHPVFEGRGGEETGGGEAQGGCACCAFRKKIVGEGTGRLAPAVREGEKKVWVYWRDEKWYSMWWSKENRR